MANPAASPELIQEKDKGKKPGTAFPHNAPPSGYVYGTSQQALGAPRAPAANNPDPTGFDLSNSPSIEGQNGRLVDAIFEPSGTPEQVARMRGAPNPATPTQNPVRVQEAAVVLGVPKPNAIDPSQRTRSLRDGPGASGEATRGVFGDFSPNGTFDNGYADMGQGIAGRGMTANRTDGGPNGVASNFTNIGADGKPTALSGVDTRTPDQIANGERIKAETAAYLSNPDGSKWSAQDNAIMAANLRDGADPYRGTSRGAKMSPGQQYVQQAMNAPRTLSKLTARQTARIMEHGSLLDSQAAIAQNNSARLGMDRQRLGIDMASGEMAIRERALGLSTAKQAADAQAQIDAARQEYLNAGDDPEKQKSAAKKLQVLSGKGGVNEWGLHVTPATKNIDGTTTPGSIYKINKATGEVVRADSEQGGKPAEQGGKYEIGQTVQRADGAKARVTAVDENGKPTKFQPI